MNWKYGFVPSSVSDFAICLLLETTVCQLESQKWPCVYSSVQFIQHILPPFPRVPRESCAPSSRCLEACPHHPRMGSLGHVCWSRNALWRSDWDQVFQPPGRVYGPWTPNENRSLPTPFSVSRLRWMDILAQSCLHTGLPVVWWTRCVAQQLCFSLPGGYIHLPSY